MPAITPARDVQTLPAGEPVSRFQMIGRSVRLAISLQRCQSFLRPYPLADKCAPVSNNSPERKAQNIRLADRANGP